MKCWLVRMWQPCGAGGLRGFLHRWLCWQALMLPFPPIQPLLFLFLLFLSPSLSPRFLLRFLVCINTWRHQHQKRRAVRNRTHRERRRTSSCLAERIAPVRRDPQRMLRDGRRPRGNFRRRRRPATTRRRVVFRSNGDDRRLPRRQHEPRLKGHLRRGRRAEHRAARRHDPHMTRAHAVHSSAPFIPHSIQSLSPPVVSPPTELVFPPLSLPHPACQSGSSPKPCPCSFNVYVSQAEVKPGCVLRQSTATYWCPKIRRREKNQRLRAVMIVRLVMIYEAC
ncbi:unnamed protein product [Closterium sp. NIES-53]